MSSNLFKMHRYSSEPDDSILFWLIAWYDEYKKQPKVQLPNIPRIAADFIHVPETVTSLRVERHRKDARSYFLVEVVSNLSRVFCYRALEGFICDHLIQYMSDQAI